MTKDSNQNNFDNRLSTLETHFTHIEKKLNMVIFTVQKMLDKGAEKKDKLSFQKELTAHNSIEKTFTLK